MKSVLLKSGSYLNLDEFKNVRHSSDFEIVLGKITSEFRFIPTANILFEQGVTSEMLKGISDLIRLEAGIGVKKAEPELLTEEEK
jgi:hypothetical protein